MLKALADFIILIGFIGGGFIGVKLYKQVDSSYDPNRIESYAKAFFIGGLIVASIFLVLGEFLKNFIVPLVIILLVIGVVLHFSDKTDGAESETTDEDSEQDLQAKNIQMQNEVGKNDVAPKFISEASNQNVTENIPLENVGMEENNSLSTPQATIFQENSLQNVNQAVSTPVLEKEVNLKKNNSLLTYPEKISQENFVQTINQDVSEVTPTSANTKKFCAYCGAKLRPNSKFCGSCGNPTNQ